jgi:hypothetical protein
MASLTDSSPCEASVWGLSELFEQFHNLDSQKAFLPCVKNEGLWNRAASRPLAGRTISLVRIPRIEAPRSP